MQCILAWLAATCPNFFLLYLQFGVLEAHSTYYRWLVRRFLFIFIYLYCTIIYINKKHQMKKPVHRDDDFAACIIKSNRITLWKINEKTILNFPRLRLIWYTTDQLDSYIYVTSTIHVPVAGALQQLTGTEHGGRGSRACTCKLWGLEEARRRHEWWSWTSRGLVAVERKVARAIFLCW